MTKTMTKAPESAYERLEELREDLRRRRRMYHELQDERDAAFVDLDRASQALVRFERSGDGDEDRRRELEDAVTRARDTALQDWGARLAEARGISESADAGEVEAFIAEHHEELVEEMVQRTLAVRGELVQAMRAVESAWEAYNATGKLWKPLDAYVAQPRQGPAGPMFSRPIPHGEVQAAHRRRLMMEQRGHNLAATMRMVATALTAGVPARLPATLRHRDAAQAD